MIALSRAVGSTAVCDNPQGLSYFDFQKVPFEYFQNVENMLIADEPGAGKTIETMCLLNNTKHNSVLLTVPTGLSIMWQKQIQKWSTKNPVVKIFDKDSDNDCDYLILPYSRISKHEDLKDVLEKRKFDLLVSDEIHNLKNKDAKRTQAFFAPNGIKAICKRTIGLSGTPIVNNPIEIYVFIKQLAPEIIDNMDWFKFGMKYCNGKKTPFGFDFKGASNTQQLGLKLRSGFMVRRTKDLILPFLPEKIISLVYLSRSKTEERVLSAMKQYDTEDVFKRTGRVDFEDLSAKRRELGVLKCVFATDYIENQIFGGHEKVVVFAYHKDVVATLKAQLAKFNPALIVGGMDIYQKDKEETKFNEDPSCKVMIASIGAGSEGINLTVASYLIFVEFSYVPKDNEQAMDRIHRIGQTKKAMIEFLVHEDSLDERILKMFKTKENNIERVLA